MRNVANDQVEREPVPFAQPDQLLVRQLLKLATERRRLEEYPTELLRQRPGIPPLDPAHLLGRISLG
jgi:hypothetical protein